jgi:predicted DNA-binding protein (MmcQ/YjbR family)
VQHNRAISWKLVAELAHSPSLHRSPAKLRARAERPPVVAAPTVRMKPEEIDRLKASKALKLLARLRKLCLAIPEVEEGTSFGSVVWRVGKKNFAMLHDWGSENYASGLAISFWVGIERQGPLEMDPRFSIPSYLGHYGWMSLSAERAVTDDELRGFVVESYRHFATRRALAKLDAQSS